MQPLPLEILSLLGEGVTQEWNVEDTLNRLLDQPDASKEQERQTEDGQEDQPSRTWQSDSYDQLEMLQLGVRERIAGQRRAIKALNAQIQAAQSLDRMSAAQERISQLFIQIHHLRTGATESEIIVRDITRDIKTLDLAKKNIVNSVTAIKRFQMLDAAYTQLTRHAKASKYKESAHALSAVNELAGHFRSFNSIEKIATVLKGVQEVQGSMRSQIMKDFQIALGRGRDSAIQNNAEGIKVSQLSDACLAIDAIGSEAKQGLLEWYVDQQLHDYRRIFRPSEEAGQLDNLSRRFGWLRRLLKQYEEGEHNRIFPKEWKLQHCLAAGCSAVTKDDLKSVLVRVASGLDVKKLLEALKETSDFETEISRKLAMPFDQIMEFSPITHRSSIVSISSVFEPYLGIFVDAQDRQLSEMISAWRNRKSSIDNSGGDADTGKAAAILPSSRELFFFYRDTLERCAQLSTKATFLELCNVYKKWLKVYAEEVLGGSLSKSDKRASSDSRLNQHEIIQACIVLNTAEYCAETTDQLEERLQQTIHADFKDKVSLETERELFKTVISTAILSLLKELEFSLDPTLNMMLRSPWKDSNIVSSESSYVLDMAAAINRVSDLVKTEIEHRKYFRSYCDKAAGLILARFTQAIVRARPISPIGAEQILLDLQKLKSCLLQLPRLAGEDQGSSALTSYNRILAKNMGKLDIMLQVIMSPDSPPEPFVDHYLVLIPCQSFSDFQKMLDLKGVRRHEQNNLLDIFLAKTSLLRDLADASFLTAIEMEGQGNTASSSGALQPISGLSGIGLGGGTMGLGLPGMHLPTTPGANSALAHNLNLFMGSLPMMQGNSSASSQGGSRAGTPQLGAAHFGSAAGHGPLERPFGFRKIGRLFSMDSK